MPQKSLIERSPVRIFDRAIGGGLGAGNIGVVLARTGVGKTGFLIGLAIDALLQERKVLYISTQESVEHITAFFEQIFHAMAEDLGMNEVPQRQLMMERGRHILCYNREIFSLEKLENSVGFLKEATGFSPGHGDHGRHPALRADRAVGDRRACASWPPTGRPEVWTSATLHREGQELDARGVPVEVARFDADLGVIIHLCPEGDHVKVRITKEHQTETAAQVSMELDPRTLLLRWR